MTWGYYQQREGKERGKIGDKVREEEKGRRRKRVRKKENGKKIRKERKEKEKKGKIEKRKRQGRKENEVRKKERKEKNKERTKEKRKKTVIKKKENKIEKRRKKKKENKKARKKDKQRKQGGKKRREKQTDTNRNTITRTRVYNGQHMLDQRPPAERSPDSLQQPPSTLNSLVRAASPCGRNGDGRARSDRLIFCAVVIACCRLGGCRCVALLGFQICVGVFCSLFFVCLFLFLSLSV